VPLGDSITEITCWRGMVWDQLAEAGLADKVQYVGSQQSNPQNCKPSTANWDQHHEGHSGWLAIDIANNYLTNWMKSTPADIVMFMLGTNDVFRGRSTNDIMAAYTKMVTIMRAANPKMKIIVCRPLSHIPWLILTEDRSTSSSPSASAPTAPSRTSTRASPRGLPGSTRPSRPS
jgi:lysophospholipase L1-like esterase